MINSTQLRTALLLLALARFPLSAQNTSVNTRPDRGWLPTGVYSGADLGTVNQVSGNLGLRIPITGLAPDRGNGHAFQLELNYNSNLYDTSPYIATTANAVPYLRSPLGQSIHGGWNYNYNYGLELEYRAQPSGGVGNCGGSDATTWRMFKMYFRTPDGALHLLVPFGLSDTNSDGFFAIGPNRNRSGCPNTEPIPTGDMNYSTVDGTYIRVTIGYSGPPSDWTSRQWRAFFPDGSEVRGFAGASDTLVDRNGNEMRVFPSTEPNGNVRTLIEDSVGRAIVIEAVLTNAVKTKDIITKAGFLGNPVTWEVNWGKIQVAAKRTSPSLDPQPLSYICGYTPDGGDQSCGLIASLPVIEKLSFPPSIINNAAYTYDFTYASADSAVNGWGELRTVNMPPRISPQSVATRADVTFTYRWDNYPTPPPIASSARNVTLSLDNPIASKTLRYHDGQAPRAELTTYSFTSTSSTMNDPAGLLTTTTFISRVPTPGDEAWARGLVYQIDGPLGRSTSRAWTNNRIYSYSSANPLVVFENVTLPGQNGANSSKTIRKDFQYDRNGNLRRLTEYDFANTVVRTTIHRYLLPTNDVTSFSNPAVTTNAGPNDFAYWNPLSTARAVNARFATEVRTGSDTGPVASYRESTFDSRWNVTESRTWDSILASSISPGGNVPAQTPTPTLNSTNSVVTKAQFADAGGVFQKGNPTAAFDANNNRTSLTYGNITGCTGSNPSLTNLYPTQRIEAAGSPVARTFELTYDCNAAVVTSERDVENNLTSTTTYDALGRPLVRTEAGLRTSRQTYYDASYISASAQDLATINDGKLVSVTHSDDLGRPYLTRVTPDTGALPAWNDATPESVGIVVKRLRLPGCRANPPLPCNPDPNHYEAVSNPYRTGQAGQEGWSVTRTDSLGRTVDVTTYSVSTPGALPPPWGASGTTLTGTTAYAYDGDLTTITDPAGKKRRIRVDTFGRTAEVVEDPDALNYSTTYTYDTLDDLTNVTQGTQTRAFSYSSLSRLTGVTNPESGEMLYGYDANGNLLSRSHRGRDANNNIVFSLTTLMPAYDALNRITGKSYSDGTPAVTYIYDTCTVGRGRLCSVANSVSMGSMNYDALGRVVNSTQSAGGSYLFRYQYNLAGNLNSLEYPSATVVTPTQPLKVSYNYNQAGRIVGVRKGEANSTDAYLSSATYWLNGTPASLQMGNGVVEETALNSLLQVTSIAAKRDTTTLWRSDLTYAAASNNGNILNQSISGTQGASPVSFNQAYEYDNLNRISNVLDSGAGAPVDAKTQVFVYDRYGNRALKQNSLNQGGVEVPTASATPAGVEAVFPGNKLNNCCNSVGDTISLNGRTLTYDGEHRVKTVAFQAAGGQNIIFESFYDGDGHRIRVEEKTNGAVTSTTNYVYDASGQLMAEYADAAVESNGRQYLTQDHLGSTRLVTKSTGTAGDIVFSRHDFLPFGEEIARGSNGYGPSPLSVKFTGKERDAETGLDNMGFRYYGGAQGRFTSPDEPLIFADSGNPQSWNLYSYGLNNPMLYSDPDGHEPCVNGINPESGNICAVATAEKAEVTTNSSPIGSLIFPLLVTTVQVAQKTQELVQPVADWLSQPRNPVCTAGYTGLGASVGFWAGGGFGSLGLAGGPAAAATIPGGAAGGSALGGAIGGFGGLVMCSTGGGTGGGGGVSGQTTSNGFWRDLKPFRGKTKTNGLHGKNKRFFERDHTHGDVEVYDGRGRHLGSADPNTGAMTKPAVSGRSITI